MVRELLLSDTLDWGELLEQALRHKMLPMLAHHIISGGLRFDVPTTIYHALGISLGVESLPDRGIPTRDSPRRQRSRRPAVFTLWSPKASRSNRRSTAVSARDT